MFQFTPRASLAAAMTGVVFPLVVACGGSAPDSLGVPAGSASASDVTARGPRCRQGDPACGPIAYELPFQSEFEAEDDRVPLTSPAARGGKQRCRYDGECVKAGCGNSCARWDVAEQAGTCELRTELTAAFCGCADGACQWFEQ